MIDRERWERAKDILLEAAALPWDEAQRVVSQRCADDPGLLAEVQSLLAYAPAPPLAAGMVVARQYRLLRQLGVGGFGVTWLAEDVALHDRRVVIKVPLHVATADTWHHTKFETEIRALAALEHPGIVSPFAVGTLDDGRPFVVMQDVDGKTLREVLKSDALTPLRAADILRQIGGALRAVADAQIYHRDLKPENVMVQRLPDGSDHVRLIDFGIATVLERGADVYVKTLPVGSLPYMAPEQERGEVTPTTDIFSFGRIACEVVAAAYSGAPQRRGHPAHQVTRVTMPGAVPTAAVRLLQRAVADDPAQRPPHADVFADALSRVLTAPAPPRQTARAALIGVLLIAVGGYAYWTRAQAPITSPRGPVASSDTVPAAGPAASIRLAIDGSDGRPVTMTGTDVFVRRLEPFRLRVTPSRTGRVYVFAESPSSGALNVLFPSSTSNDGSSLVEGGRSHSIPDTSWLQHDGRDADRLWLVWSMQPVDQLERTRAWTTQQHRGRIGDPAERQSILNMLRRLRRSATPAQGELTILADDAVIATAIDVRQP